MGEARFSGGVIAEGWAEGRLTPEEGRQLWLFMHEWESKLTELEKQAFDLLLELRGRGATWRWIGAALGVSPQAAQQRFKRYQAYEDGYWAFQEELIRAHQRGE